MERRLSIGMRSESKDDAPQIEREVAESVDNQGTSVSYTIKQLVSIESDNKPHKVQIADVPLTAEFDYLIVPALSENAYFRSQTTNESEYQLLAGPMNVFINNVFVTQSQLNTVNPTERFTMFLGVDKTIKLRVKPVKNMDSKQGLLFGKKNIQEVKKAIVITNTKNEPVNISVYQQLPFSKDETIKIKQIDPPENDENTRKDEFSIIEWKCHLEQSKYETINFAYVIESNPDKELGLVEQTDFEKTSY